MYIFKARAYQNSTTLVLRKWFYHHIEFYVHIFLKTVNTSRICVMVLIFLFHFRFDEKKEERFFLF